MPIKQLGIQPGLTPEYIRRERDLIKQINDAIAGQDATIAALRAEPTLFAFAAGTTTGTGDITTLYAYGCTLEVQGTSVVARFTTARPSDEYVFNGLFMTTLARTINSELSRKLPDSCGIVFRDPVGGTPWRADNQIFTTLIWAMGPRA